jgi:hypothetical protein
MVAKEQEGREEEERDLFARRINVQRGMCDRTAQNSSVLSPKPVHVAIKQ